MVFKLFLYTDYVSTGPQRALPCTQGVTCASTPRTSDGHRQNPTPCRTQARPEAADPCTHRRPATPTPSHRPRASHPRHTGRNLSGATPVTQGALLADRPTLQQHGALPATPVTPGAPASRPPSPRRPSQSRPPVTQAPWPARPPSTPRTGRLQSDPRHHRRLPADPRQHRRPGQRARRPRTRTQVRARSDTHPVPTRVRTHPHPEPTPTRTQLTPCRTAPGQPTRRTGTQANPSNRPPSRPVVQCTHPCSTGTQLRPVHAINTRHTGHPGPAIPDRYSTQPTDRRHSTRDRPVDQARQPPSYRHPPTRRHNATHPAPEKKHCEIKGINCEYQQ
ncbi:uncharacterized protein [Salvelinus sp. IW2-2015]|uniref:uncharacterized protein n=1 Tax=Salvelinus sp. IW2-2015 TaxID=2691554 RepID=UPI0038D4C8B3